MATEQENKSRGADGKRERAMIDRIISALESMQEDMEEHGELQKARGVSSAIWLIEFMKDFADRKTEPSGSEKPSNCDGCKEGQEDCYGCPFVKWDEPQTDCSWK